MIAGNNTLTEVADYYRSGKLLWYKRFYVNGLVNGTMYGYYESGKKEFESNFLNGLADGSQTEWYETGEVKTKGIAARIVVQAWIIMLQGN